MSRAKGVNCLEFNRWAVRLAEDTLDDNARERALVKLSGEPFPVDSGFERRDEKCVRFASHKERVEEVIFRLAD